MKKMLLLFSHHTPS